MLVLSIVVILDGIVFVSARSSLLWNGSLIRLILDNFTVESNKGAAFHYNSCFPLLKKSYNPLHLIDDFFEESRSRQMRASSCPLLYL